MKIGEHETHVLADAFPLLHGGDYKRLADGIKENGLFDPICLYQGKVLDGRNRYIACLSAGVAPRFFEFEGSEYDAIQYVRAKNIERRDLTDFDRICALEALGKEQSRLMREDKKRLRIEKGQGQGRLPVPDHTTDMAHALKDNGIPELVELVQNGDVSLGRAAAVAKLPHEAQRKAVEDFKAYEAKPVRAKTPPGFIKSNETDLSPVDLAAARAGYVVLSKNVHPEVRACGALLCRMVPGLGQ